MTEQLSKILWILAMSKLQAFIRRLKPRTIKAQLGFKRAVIITITKNIIMKPRRMTRNSLLKTSIASVFFIVILFCLTYFAVLMSASRKKNLEDRTAWNEYDLKQLRKSLKLDSQHDGWVKKLLQGMDKNKFAVSNLVPIMPGSDPQFESQNPLLWDTRSLEDNNHSKPTCHNNAILTIVITSSPQNYAQRQAIRDSWCSNEENLNFQCIFLIGRAEDGDVNTELERESLVNQDILFGNYADSYRNLTYKVLHGFLWAMEACGSNKFILKTDDDCFVNSKVIVNFLQNYNTRQHDLYVGNIYTAGKQSKVIRDPSSKWAVSFEEYSKNDYPAYASGEGYILSIDVVKKMLLKSHEIRPFPNEDAYVGVLAFELNIEPLQSYRFTLATPHWSLCNFLYLMIIHSVPSSQQQVMFKNSIKAGVECRSSKQLVNW